MLSKNIKKHRTKLGLTQEGLARKADIPYNSLIKLESGAIKDPRVGTLKKVADALNLKIDDLMGA